MFEMLLSPSLASLLYPVLTSSNSNSNTPNPSFPSISNGMEKERERLNRHGDCAGPMRNHWMLPLPLLALPSVPLVSDDSALLREFRLASQGMVSRRGGIRSLMRSRPLASSKLLILCWGEKPLIAGVGGKKDDVIRCHSTNTHCLKFTILL